MSYAWVHERKNFFRPKVLSMRDVPYLRAKTQRECVLCERGRIPIRNMISLVERRSSKLTKDTSERCNRLLFRVHH